MKHSNRIASLIIIAFALMIIPGTMVMAQTENLQSIETILNPDGTINRDATISGSINPDGFTMQYGENGEPVFIPAPQKNFAPLMASDNNWDDRFYITEVDSFVTAIASDINGNIYIGGSFKTINGYPMNYIAMWNGSSWSSLGSGMNDRVTSIAINGTDVYVGGWFIEAGGNSANRIAKWDGSSWSSLGSGVNDGVYAIAISGNDVYAGGDFTMAGGSSANRVAKWDGNSWTSLGSGADNHVYALAADMGGMGFISSNHAQILRNKGEGKGG